PPQRAEQRAGERGTAQGIAGGGEMVINLFANMIHPPWSSPRRSNANGGGLRRAEHSHHLGVTGRRIARAPMPNRIQGRRWKTSRTRLRETDGRRDCVELRTAEAPSLWQSRLRRARDKTA